MADMSFKTPLYEPTFTLYLYNFLYRFDLISRLPLGDGEFLSYEIRRTTKPLGDNDEEVSIADIAEYIDSSYILEFLVSLGTPYTIIPNTLRYQIIVEATGNAFIRIQCQTSTRYIGIPHPDDIANTFGGGVDVITIMPGFTATAKRTFSAYNSSPLQLCDIEFATSIPMKAQGYIFTDKRMDYIQVYQNFVEPSLNGMLSAGTHVTNPSYDMKSQTDPFIKFSAIFRTCYTSTALSIRIFYFPKEVFGYPVNWMYSNGIDHFAIGIRKTKDVTQEGIALQPEWFQLAINTVRPQTLSLISDYDSKAVIIDGEQYRLYDESNAITIKGRTVTNFTMVPKDMAIRNRQNLIELCDFPKYSNWRVANFMRHNATASITLFSMHNEYVGLPTPERAYTHAFGILTLAMDSPIDPGLVDPNPLPNSVARNLIPEHAIDAVCAVLELNKGQFSMQLKPLSYFPTEIRFLIEANIDVCKVSMNPESNVDIINKVGIKATQQKQQVPKKGFLNFLNTKK